MANHPPLDLVRDPRRMDSIAHGLIYRAIHNLPLNEPTLAGHKYLNLTEEQVRAAFAKWVRPDDLVQVTVGPLPK